MEEYRMKENHNIVKERSLLEVTPRVCLQDVHTTIRARGLPPHTNVTFKATLTDQKGIPYCSNAFYKTDVNGQVDLDTAPSLGGSYDGIFPAGLLTTLKPAPGQFPYHRLVAKDTSIPFKIELTLHKGQETLEEFSTPIDSIEVERHLLAPGVRRIPVREGRVRGVLYVPAGPGPFPGVVDLFGGVGGCVQHRSAMLASRGIASLALAYFGYEDLPKSYARIEVEYFQEAVEYLLSRNEVIKGKCGVIGTCLGGLMALTMAIYCKEVEFIVTINVAALVTSSTLTYKGNVIMKGQPLSSEYMTFDSKFRITPLKDLWLPNIRLDSPNMIPVHQIADHKKLIFIAGDDDSMVGDHSARILEAYMKSHNKPNVKSIIFPGAGHMIEPPYGVLIEHAYQVTSNPVGKDPPNYVMYWGGNAEGMCKAQEESWQIMQQFFKSNIINNEHVGADHIDNNTFVKSKL